MSVIYLLIAASFFVAAIFLILFIWAMKTGQFKDKHTPAMRILFDDTIQTNKLIKKSKEDLDAN